MASQVGSLVLDQNLSIHYNGASVGGKTSVSKAVKKAGLTGRKPLGDLSNSVKPTLIQTSKKQNSNLLSFTDRDSCGNGKVTNDANKKKSISKPSEKVQIGGRKALSDISNSAKPHPHETSKKKNNGNKTKLGVLAKEKIGPGAIAEEGFLHNHQECIKAHTRGVDMDEFLKTIGLDSGFPHWSASPWSSPPFTKMKPKTPLKHLELEEMAEQQLLFGNQSHRKLELSPPCKTPSHDLTWKDHDHINFELMATPALPKH